MDDYRARRTLFETESTFTIENGALVRSIGGVVRDRVVLADVTKVALTYQPLTLVNRWVCSVASPSGRIWIPSSSFTGPGQTEDRRAGFRAFVTALTGEIAAEPSTAHAEFVQGNNWSAYSALAMLVCLVIIALLLVLGVIGGMLDGAGVAGFSWIPLPAMVTFMASVMVWRVWRKNRRHTYDPRALPADFAPPR
jgi:hypothetical protein